MLVSRRNEGADSGQGCLRAALEELRRQHAGEPISDNGLRQRLLVLEQRLTRVRSLGNEYARVAFSQDAEEALAPRSHGRLCRGAATV
jgi:hypothetical protein